MWTKPLWFNHVPSVSLQNAIHSWLWELQFQHLRYMGQTFIPRLPVRLVQWRLCMWMNSGTISTPNASPGSCLMLHAPSTSSMLGSMLKPHHSLPLCFSSDSDPFTQWHDLTFFLWPLQTWVFYCNCSLTFNGLSWPLIVSSFSCLHDPLKASCSHAIKTSNT